MRKIFFFKTGFTLVEIMVVIIIIGVLATIAIPNYSKTVDRSRLQDAMQQLTTLHAANMIYRAQSGTGYLAATYSGSTAVRDINENLGINIIANGFAYSYTGTATSFTATANLGTAYTVTVREIDINTSAPSITCPPSPNPANPCCTPNSGGAACP